jgi:hypothetical protein
VDDPTSAKSALEEKPINNEETVSTANSAPVQIAPKVYYYGSGSVSSSSSGYQSQSDERRAGRGSVLQHLHAEQIQ